MSYVRREGDRKVAIHLHNAVEHLTSAGAAAREGAYQEHESDLVWCAKDHVEDVIREYGGDPFEALATENLPERFPPMERARGPIENRGDVMMALQDIDAALYRKPEPWPFKALSNALRSIVAKLEAEEEGRTVVWDDDNATVANALKTALRERTPVAYFAYGAINHSGGFHSGQHGTDGKRAPNQPGWFYHEAEHDQWVGPFPTEKQAREGCANVGDEE